MSCEVVRKSKSTSPPLDAAYLKICSRQTRAFGNAGKNSRILDGQDGQCDRTCCISLCRPRDQPSNGIQTLIHNRGTALDLSFPHSPKSRDYAQARVSSEGFVHAALSGYVFYVRAVAMGM